MRRLVRRAGGLGRSLAVWLPLLAAALLSLPVAPGAAEAQPWPRPPGELFTVTSSFAYTTTQQTDAGGDVSPLPDGGRFTSIGTGVYFEYGLTPRLTLQGDLNAALQRFTSDGFEQRNLALADQRLGLRYTLVDGAWAASLGGKVGVPWLYSTDDRPLPGYGQYSVQMNAALGRGGSVAGAEAWTLLKAGVRRYLGGAADQLRTQTLLGMHFDRRWGAVLELNNTVALQEGEFRLGDGLTNPNVRSGFTTIQAMASLIYEQSPRSTVQVGVFRDLWGLESGRGTGVQVGFWYRY